MDTRKSLPHQTKQIIATRKYFTENGILAFPTDSIPHSKFLPSDDLLDLFLKL
jgi:hypothetical protein